MADAPALSASAKKRAAKKARDAAAAEAQEPAAPPPPPAAEPKAKAKGKAKAEPAAKAAAEPKAEPKGKAKAEPKADAKAKAKGKAKAEPKAAPEPKEEPKAEPKAAAAKPKAKQGSKAKSKAAPAPPEPEVEAPKPQSDELINYVLDDGQGGGWEVSSGLSKKKEKENARKAEQAALMDAHRKAGGIVGAKNVVPGMAPTDPRMTAAQQAAVSQAASADVARILAMKNPEAAAAEPVVTNSSTAVINVPEARIGIVIGPKGATINLVQEKTKAKVDTSGDVFTVTGSASAVAEAEAAIRELISKGFCSLQYDDFSENSVNVQKAYFPDLIGKGGCIIQAIKKALKVEVNMPPAPESAPASKKFKVTLAGSAKAVEEAKEVINSIIEYGHHEITHPGEVHAEIEVDNWSLRYIIGKGGSEMKHIQKNWNVKMAIPRDHSVNQNVLIIGELSNVERAKTYVEKVMWNAANQAKGRDRQDNAGDDFGDDEEVEDWMRPYIYKRR